MLYCRVSSDEQKTNTSLDFQEKKLRQYCEAHGYNVIACYHEDFSAKHHDFVQPEMKKIRDYCKAHKNEYNRMINRQKAQLDKLEDRRELLETPNRGKIEPQLKYSMSLIDNIDKFFKYAPADAKIRALSSIFSEKIEFDGENFRTKNLNSVLGLIYQQTNELRNPKKENGES